MNFGFSVSPVTKFHNLQGFVLTKTVDPDQLLMNLADLDIHCFLEKEYII